MRVSIIGLGLIGGSIALDLRRNGFASSILGVENNSEHEKIALERKIVDEVVSMEVAVNNSDIIILAVSADVTVKLLPQLLDKVNNQIVIDVCSIKRKVCDSVSAHPKRQNFVATHPMAGTENSGPKAVLEGLFENKVVVFVDKSKSGKMAVDTIAKMFKGLKMRIISMEVEEHDMHTAYVSHISHLSSMALALTVLEKEENKKNIFDLASGGFESTVRLAKSSSEMWTSIFINNSDNILVVLDEYIRQLSKFKISMEASDASKIESLINNSNKINKILK